MQNAQNSSNIHICLYPNINKSSNNYSTNKNTVNNNSNDEKDLYLGSLQKQDKSPLATLNLNSINHLEKSPCSQDKMTLANMDNYNNSKSFASYIMKDNPTTGDIYSSLFNDNEKDNCVFEYESLGNFETDTKSQLHITDNSQGSEIINLEKSKQSQAQEKCQSVALANESANAKNLSLLEENKVNQQQYANHKDSYFQNALVSLQTIQAKQMQQKLLYDQTNNIKQMLVAYVEKFSLASKAEEMGRAQEKQGEILKNTGIAAFNMGSAQEKLGVSTKIQGQCLEKAGIALEKAGIAMLSNPFTASAGAALTAKGKALKTAGIAMEETGKALESAGKSAKLQGKAQEKQGLSQLLKGKAQEAQAKAVKQKIQQLQNNLKNNLLQKTKEMLCCTQEAQNAEKQKNYFTDMAKKCGSYVGKLSEKSKKLEIGIAKTICFITQIRNNILSIIDNLITLNNYSYFNSQENNLGKSKERQSNHKESSPGTYIALKSLRIAEV